jgi:hypothetical protein
VQTETDLVAGSGKWLRITRTYRSLRSNWRAQSAAFGWSFSFDREFTVNLGGSSTEFPVVTGSLGDGSAFDFRPRTSGEYAS